MRAYVIFCSLLALSSLSLASRPAHAHGSCSADTDCVKGWTCQVSGGSACTSPACPPGEKCEAQPTDCTPVEYKSCQPGPCRADSDCASGMVCYTHTDTDCAPSACAAGQECPPPACEPKTESACVPRYVLPCSTATDCGPGFQCASSGEQCACSGSAPQPEPTPEEPSCICEPSHEMRCQAATVNCSADSDCTPGWTCAVISSTSDCVTSSEPVPTPGGDGQDGGKPVPECQPAVAVKACVPPYYELIQGGRGVSHDSAGSPTFGIGEGTSNGAIPPTASDGSAPESTSSAGCSVKPGSRSGSALALLGVFGLFSALRRRRAR